MNRVERSKQQEEDEEKNRPVACRACSSESKDCEQCNDLLVPYEASKWGPRCQAVCRLEQLMIGNKNGGDLYAERLKMQCRRAACFHVEKLPGYYYCAAHSNVYRNLLNPKVATLRVDEDIQDQYFAEMLLLYRSIDHLEKFDFAKKNDFIWWWETGGSIDLVDDDDMQMKYKFVKKMLRNKKDDIVQVHVEATFWGTHELTFIDTQTGLVFGRMDKDAPTFPFIVMLYAREVTYEWLYKYLGATHDDQEQSGDIVLRNRLLANALLLDPARLFFSRVEDYEEPTEEQYHDYKKTASVPWLRYPLTNRAVSLMPTRCSRRLKTDCKGSILFPVVRYNRLYYNKQELKGDSPFCGTFYFYEIQSSIVLNLGKCLIAASKPHAMWLLLNEGVEKYGKTWREALIPPLLQTKDDVDRYNQGKKKDDLLPRQYDGDAFVNILHAWSKGRDKLAAFWKFALPEWPEDATREDYEIYYFSLLQSKQEKHLPVAKNVRATPLWPYDKKEMKSTLNWEIGSHDHFDQSLCHLARFLGYDTVLLQHEHGSKRSVTEVLDTRLHSYDYLYRTTRDPIHEPWFPASARSAYPTVWMADYRFIQV